VAEVVEMHSRKLREEEKRIIGHALREVSNGPIELIDEVLESSTIHRGWPERSKLETELMRYCAKLGLSEGSIAMTIGPDIYIDRDLVGADGRVSMHLLAHEVTHVLQMLRVGGFEQYAEEFLPRYLEGGYADDPFEVEADAVADSAASMRMRKAS